VSDEQEQFDEQLQEEHDTREHDYRPISPEDRVQVIKEVVAGLIPATAAQIGAALGHLSKELGRVNKEITVQQRIYTAAKRDYSRAFDLKMLELAHPPEEDRMPVGPMTARAMARVHAEVYALGLEMDTQKDKLKELLQDFQELQDRIRVGQTNAATVRSEHQTMGYGGTP
jgi:hypothetical protein